MVAIAVVLHGVVLAQQPGTIRGAVASARSAPVYVGSGVSLFWGKNLDSDISAAEVTLIDLEPGNNETPLEGIVTVHREIDGVPVAYGWMTARSGVWFGSVEVNNDGVRMGVSASWQFRIPLLGEGSLQHDSGRIGEPVAGHGASAIQFVETSYGNYRIVNPTFEFVGLTPGRYVVVSWTSYRPSLRLARAQQAFTNGGPFLKVVAKSPSISLSSRALRLSAGAMRDDERSIAVWQGGAFEIIWTSDGLDQVRLTRNQEDLAQGERGSTMEDGLMPNQYIYEVSGLAPDGSILRKSVKVGVLARDVSLIGAPSVPQVALNAEPASLFLGQTVTLRPQVVNPADLSSVRLSGPSLPPVNAVTDVTLTPATTGRPAYTLAAEGWVTLSWVLPFLPDKLFLNGPGGTRADVSGRAVATVSTPGDYSLTWLDDDGAEFTSEPVPIAVPHVEARTELTVSPRIDLFELEAPPAPSAVLALSSPGRVEVGDLVSWLGHWNGRRASLSFGDEVQEVLGDGTMLTHAQRSGLRAARLTAFPHDRATLRWSVAGAEAVELNGSPVVGGTAQVAAGPQRLRVLGREGTETWSEVRAWTPFEPVTAEASVPVFPKIQTLSVVQPERPQAAWTVDPDQGWVAPATVALRWSTTAAETVQVSASGRGMAWSDSSPEGSASLTLSPGPHRFSLVAKPRPAELRWQVAGAEKTEWIDPAGVVSGSDAQGSRQVYSSGNYLLRATGADGLVSERLSEAVLRPPDEILEREQVVDVVLSLSAGKGGSVRGGGVKAYGSRARFSAEPLRGYRWVEWRGDFSEPVNPATLLMENNQSVAALFAPNRYLITTSVIPEGTGTVTGAGDYEFESLAILEASPARYYQFVRWTDGNRDSVRRFAIDGDGTYVAEMERIRYQLTVSQVGGGTGSVDAVSGLRPAGIPVSVQAAPDSRSRFMGWTGDGVATGRSVQVDMEGDRTVTARFEPKLAQTITFPVPRSHEQGETANLQARSSAGLPVRYEWISGPGTLQGASVAVTGVGSIRVRAVADGDDTYLPADPVEVAFEGVSAPAVRLNEQGAEVRLHDTDHAVPNRILKD